MSKKEEIENLEDDGITDEYEEWQHDLSTESAITFIDEALLPILDIFDYQNENESYVPGTAGFVLLIKLVQRMYEEGFTKEEVFQMVDQSDDMSLYETIH